MHTIYLVCAKVPHRGLAPETERAVMRVELFLLGVKKFELLQVTNLIGMSEELVVHSDITGQLYFQRTENVRVQELDADFCINRDGIKVEDPQGVFHLLQEEFVEICFGSRIIMRGTLRPEQVEVFTQKVCS